MPVPAPACKGYILASQDPYAIVPCPHPPSVPAVLSSGCAASNRKRSCKQAAYCEMHHCGGCKKALRAAQSGDNGDAKAGKAMVPAVDGVAAVLVEEHELR
jgi:hypothetical protein